MTGDLDWKRAEGRRDRVHQTEVIDVLLQNETKLLRFILSEAGHAPLNYR